MELLIDLAWLLERQALIMPTELDIADYSALAAAVQRHRVNTPRIGYEPDNAWRAAALLVTIAREEPLPARKTPFSNHLRSSEPCLGDGMKSGVRLGVTETPSRTPPRVRGARRQSRLPMRSRACGPAPSSPQAGRPRPAAAVIIRRLSSSAASPLLGQRLLQPGVGRLRLGSR